MEFDRINLFNEKMSVRIPQKWKDEYEEDGTYIFFDPPKNHSWLRVSLITTNNRPTQDEVFGLVSDAADRRNGKLFKVGEMYCAIWEEASKDSENVTVLYWQLAAVAGEKIRVAVFSYAVLNERLKAADFSDERALIQSCIFATQFNPNPPDVQAVN